MKYFLLIIYILSGITYAQPNVIWTKKFGQDTTARSLLLTNDGGYVTVGTLDGIINDDVLLYKMNSLGERQWTKTLGKANPYYEDGVHFTKTSDGGYVIVGNSHKAGPINIFDTVLMKSDSLGDTLWTKTYDESEYDEAVMVKQAHDGGYIILSKFSNNMGATSFPWLVKTDSLGNAIWQKSFDYSSTHEFAEAKSLLTTQDGGCLILVRMITLNFILESRIIRTDALGDTLWTRRLQANRQGVSMKKTSDGGYIILGDRNSNIFWYKTDSLGNRLWALSFGQSNRDEEGADIQQLPDEGYIIVGNIRNYSNPSEERVWLIRTDASGDVLWSNTYNDGGFHRASRIKSTPDGGYIILGYVYDGGYGYPGLMKTAPDLTDIKKNSKPIISQTPVLYQNYPNPFNPTTSIRYSIGSKHRVLLRVYDLIGKEIATLGNEEKPAGEYNVEFDASKLSSGIYFYQLQAGDFTETKKMILMR
jgi:hypothetical protein